MKNSSSSIEIAIAWCLAWGEGREPQFDLSVLQEMRRALNAGEEVPEEVREIVDRVQQLQAIDKDYFPATLDELKSKYPELWNQETKIGLVYGGATKIKQYVFEAAKIQDVRGASALLDRINLIDLPAFFNKNPQPNSTKYNAQCNEIKNWLNDTISSQSQRNDGQYKISEALIPELVIYSTGGNILAFCPAAFVDNLTNAIEKRYTEETLTANSCAVGDRFSILEIRFGLLKQARENTPWLDWYHQNYNQPLVQAYFGFPTNELERIEQFKNRKSFNELTTKLAVLFNQRRSGNDFSNRPSRRYPPMFETHPYLMRDGNERRSALTSVQPPKLPRETNFSETSARKHRVGYRAKKGSPQVPEWYKESNLKWEPGIIEGWVDRFDRFLEKNPSLQQKYYGDLKSDNVEIAENLSHIGNASKNFIAYIYADGNNMGGYIQKIRTPQEYQEFSKDVELATEYAVYKALAESLYPHELQNFNDEDSTLSNGNFVHPFEIITIGGDDIFLIVPADKALAIAQTIGQRFEQILLKQLPLVENSTATEQIKGHYQIQPSNKPIDPTKIHRYKPTEAPPSQCQLSTSSGVLITAYDTPIYYAKDFIDQLLKSAKERAKKLNKAGYCGGTVDIMIMKSVTMISSDVNAFRKQALFKRLKPNLKLYATPYTLHELGGLIASIEALKTAKFPKSQLYQIRSLLERGKHTAILNYRYFRTRLQQGKSELIEHFEEAWCQPKDPNNPGNLAPWMYDDGSLETDKSDYPLFETIWRDLVDLYDFIAFSEDESMLESELATKEVEA
jgi:CRISPR-associated protein Cmr2